VNDSIIVHHSDVLGGWFAELKEASEIGYFRFAKYAIPLILHSGGGTIVNISSGAAFRVLKDFCVYPVTEAAINALTRTLAIRAYLLEKKGATEGVLLGRKRWSLRSWARR